MPLQKLQFRPGVNRESTTLANEGGWFESDKVRFRSGFPEKIGGWVTDTGKEYPTNTDGTTLTLPNTRPVTLSIASPCVVTLANSLPNGTQVKLTTTGSLPTGLNTNQVYFVVNSTTTTSSPIKNTCQLSLTLDGPPINTSGSQSGSQSLNTVIGYSFWGTCRSLFNWITLAGSNLLGLGTNLKYYIQNTANGSFYDITPIRFTSSAGAATFTAVTGSNVLTVTEAGHGATNGDFVSFTGAVGLGGNVTAAILNTEFQLTYVSSTSYTINIPVFATSSDTGTGGSATVAAHQIYTGGDVYSYGVGWGAGGWSGNTNGTTTGWGSPAPASQGVGVQLRLWSESNFGQNLLINPRGGPLYAWTTNVNPTVYDRASLISASSTSDSTCPSVANFVLVSDASRFTFLFGTNDPTGTYATTVQDPMQIRWSDQNSYTSWTPSITNQAGGIRLSRGSQIVTAIQTRQEILVLTDAAIYSLQYLGPPYIWGSQIMGDNISIIAPNAIATANNVTYWMGADKFYMYSGRVETLPCTLRQYIYDDINMTQSYQFFAGTNEGYNEIWWFYCSRNSSTVDRYVIYNHLERTWYYGTMARTAWDDSPLRSEPMAAGYRGQLLYHETGVDDASTYPASPIDSYVQTADFDIGDGHNFGFVWRLIPDVTFDGSGNLSTGNIVPSVNFTVYPRQNPGAAYGVDDNPTVTSSQTYNQSKTTYNVQQFTQQVYVRLRGRQMAFRVESNTLGTQWQLGTPRIEIRPDGRR